MDRIGRYEIVERLGAGGFATVYLARDPVLDSQVAIKVLAENWTDKSDLRERFIREAQLLRRLDSDRVITVHDIGELPSEQPYFVMALVDGGTLDERLGIVDPPMTVAIRNVGTQLAECLRVIHDQGMIHRDIKPSNLLIAGSRSRGERPESGRVLHPTERLVLGDFGLAKDILLQGSAGLTISAGTGGYAAPEQMSPMGVPDERTDLYAATGVIYRVVTAHTPPSFDLATDTVPFPDHEQWMNGELGQFFRRGMAFQPELRFESIEAWLAGLRDAVDSLSSGHPTGGANPTVHAAWAGDAASPPPSSGSFQQPGTWAPPTVHSGPQWDQQPVHNQQSVPSGGSQPVPGPSAPAAHHGMTPSSQPAQPGGQIPSLPSGPGGPASAYPSGPNPYVPTAQHYQTAPPQAFAPSAPSPGYSPAGLDPRSGEPYLQDPHRSSAGYGEVSSPRRIGQWLVLAAVAIAVVGAALWYTLLRPVGPVVAGPDGVTAGDTVTFTAEYDDAVAFEWTDWNDSVQQSNEFDVTAVAPGVLTFTVAAIGADGERSPTTEHSIVIEESPNGPRIEGPATVVVGQEQVYTVSAPDGYTDFEWIDGNGSRQGDIYRVAPSRAGTFRVVLIATLPNGQRIGTARVIEFVDP